MFTKIDFGQRTAKLGLGFAPKIARTGDVFELSFIKCGWHVGRFGIAGGAIPFLDVLLRYGALTLVTGLPLWQAKPRAHQIATRFPIVIAVRVTNKSIRCGRFKSDSKGAIARGVAGTGTENCVRAGHIAAERVSELSQVLVQHDPHQRKKREQVRSRWCFLKTGSRRPSSCRQSSTHPPQSVPSLSL